MTTAQKQEKLNVKSRDALIPVPVSGIVRYCTNKDTSIGDHQVLHQYRYHYWVSLGIVPIQIPVSGITPIPVLGIVRYRTDSSITGIAPIPVVGIGTHKKHGDTTTRIPVVPTYIYI